MFSWAQVHEAACVMAGGLQAAGVGPGDAVAVLAGAPRDVASLVQAIWMCGASVTMVHHPTHRSDLSAWIADTETLLTGIGASALVVGCPFESAVEQFSAAGTLRCVRVEELLSGPQGRPVWPDESEVALLQLTSGSTGRPRAVSITYRNLEANFRSSARANEVDGRRDTGVSWLPLFHDMGMTGFLLFPMYHGANAVVVTPVDFLSDPLVWPRLIDRYRGTMTAAPNFAYDLVARRLQPEADGAFDLSCVRFALSGGERIDPKTIERFLAATARFGMRSQAIVPAYGMAEATLAISFTRPGEHYRVCANDPESTAGDAHPAARVALGRPLDGIELRVVGHDGSALPEAQIGEFQIRGGSVTAGYRTQAGFEPACDAEGWLSTGDLGYLTDDGQPVICGRSKDALIISGRTVSPDDVESAVDGVAGVRPGGVAAVRLAEASAPEGFAVVVESKCHADPDDSLRIRSESAQRIFDSLGLSPRCVVVVSPGWIPKTSSGKLRRTEAARRLSQDGLLAGRAMPEGKGGPPVGVMERWVADVWAVLLDIPRPGRLDRFTDLGGDSVAAVEFSRMLNERFGVNMSVDRFAAQPTIAAVVANLEPGSGEQRASVVRLRTDDAGPLYLMVPGYGGHAWMYTRLADALPGPCDVLALSLMDVSLGPRAQVRAVVRSAVLDALRPYAEAGRCIVLAGYSFGGVIAADLACHLDEHGFPAVHLLLIDPHPLNPRDWPFPGIRDVANTVRRRTRRPSATLSPVARKLDDDIDRANRKLRRAYLDGTVRLPAIPLSWLQSREMATMHSGRVRAGRRPVNRLLLVRGSSTQTIFGTPIEEIDREIVESLHSDLFTPRVIPIVADWCGRHAPPGSVALAERRLAPVRLRRNAFQPDPELVEIRERAGVETFATPFGATAYLVTRHADVTTVLTDHTGFANSPRWARSADDDDSIRTGLKSGAGNLFSLDPPEHTRLRQMLVGQFSTQRMKLLKPRIREIVEQQLAEMERTGAPADLMASFALPIPSLVICELLGVPNGDRESFQRRTARFSDLSTSLAQQMELDREIRDYMSELVGAARRNAGDDVIGSLVREYGSLITDDELIGTATVLLLAGFETTANMLGLGTLALLTHPDQLEVVRDNPAAVGPAVEELLRWVSIVQTSPWPRFATRDVEVAGVTIPAGRSVLASLLAANRDPAVFDDPDTLDIRRRPTRHLAFGYGPHYCLGAPLARLEMTIAFPALLRRFPGLALREPLESMVFRSANIIYGLESLPVTW